MTANEKIFISIASYRDPELLTTIRECIKRADKPENLVFSIAWQHSEEDDWDTLEEFVTDDRFKIIDIPYDKSDGTCWARSLVQSKYTDEQYTLQLDSHHRFVKGWDTKCKNMITQLQADGHKKPLLTAYLPSYNPENDPQDRVKEIWKLNFDRFTPEGIIFMLPAVLEDWESRKKPVPTRFFSAHFVFTLGEFNKEVPYDPNLYFHGEEITLAVRAFTHGYDLFIPNQIIAWHEYTRKGRIRHWDENKRWETLNVASLKRAKSLLGVDGATHVTDFGDYGFGTVRTKEEYERYAGIRFEDRAVQQYTLSYFDPPNTTYATEQAYTDSFLNIFRHCLDVYKKSIPDEDWDGWVVAFEMDDGTVLHRQDVDRNEIGRLKSIEGDWYNVWRQFHTKIIPDKVIVWPFSANQSIGDKGWGPRVEIRVPKV